MSSSSVKFKKEITTALTQCGANLSPGIASKCMAIATNYNLSAESLAEIWEAHSMNKNVNDLNDVTFTAFRNTVIESCDQFSTSPATDIVGAVVPRTSLGKRSSPHVTPSPHDKKMKNHNLDTNNQQGISAIDAIGNDTTPPATPNKTSSLTMTKDKYASSSPATSSSSAVVTPSRPTQSDSKPKFSPKLPKYNERTNAAQIVTTYNPNNLAPLQTNEEESHTRKCEIMQPNSFPHPRHKYRHMFDPMDERSAALDKTILQMEDAMIQTYNIPTPNTLPHDEEHDSKSSNHEDTSIAPLAPVGIPSQTPQTCIGRICNEAHEGKINPTSILLEGSRHWSNGARIQIDLSMITNKNSPQNTNSSNPVQDLSLFPGQIVAIEGMNSTGRKLVASRICEGVPHPTQKSTPEQLLDFHYTRQDGKALKLMVVAGPYTTPDNLNYEPLVDLLANVREEKADVVILMGPFVDERQPLVANGEMTLDTESGDQVYVTPQNLFDGKIGQQLEEFYKETGLETQFILVPSLDDAIAEPVYPQPPLSDAVSGGILLDLPGSDGLDFASLGIHHIENVNIPTVNNRNSNINGENQPIQRRVHCVSNPCTIRINEINIGMTSTDALLHMSTDETNANLPPGSRLTRLTSHFLNQRSYYPSFPPPQIAAANMNLALSHMNKYSMPCRPDLFLLPSKLAPFCKPVIDGTVVLNPGHLVKGSSGGTYALMDVHPMKREVLEAATGGNVELEHGVQDRLRVEVKRI